MVISIEATRAHATQTCLLYTHSIRPILQGSLLSCDLNDVAYTWL